MRRARRTWCSTPTTTACATAARSGAARSPSASCSARWRLTASSFPARCARSRSCIARPADASRFLRVAGSKRHHRARRCVSLRHRPPHRMGPPEEQLVRRERCRRSRPLSWPRLGTRRWPVPDRRRGDGRGRASPTARSSASTIPGRSWASARRASPGSSSPTRDIELLTTRPDATARSLPLATRFVHDSEESTGLTSIALDTAVEDLSDGCMLSATQPASRDGWRLPRAGAPSRCNRPMC